VTLAEACFGEDGLLGVEADLPEEARPDAALFGESSSRIVVSFDPADRARAEAITREAGAPFRVIGRVGGDRLRINDWIDLPLAEIHDAWRSGLARALREEVSGASLFAPPPRNESSGAPENPSGSEGR
jgi:phosphoribosylformylglycinamidine synthase